jgi:predicted transcriptional regulator
MISRSIITSFIIHDFLCLPAIANRQSAISDPYSYPPSFVYRLLPAARRLEPDTQGVLRNFPPTKFSMYYPQRVQLGTCLKQSFSFILRTMEVHFNSDLQAKLDKLATETGRPTRELVEDVIAGYFDELAQTRETLDRRYDDLKSGRVKPLDGEEFFENLRHREDELLKKQSPQ